MSCDEPSDDSTPPPAAKDETAVPPGHTHSSDDLTDIKDEEMLQHRLDEMFGEARGDVALAAQLDDATGVDLVVPALEAIWSREDRARSQQAARQGQAPTLNGAWRITLTLAAVLLIGVTSWQLLADPTLPATTDPSGSVLLGSVGFRLANTAAVFDGHSGLAWVHPHAEGLRFEVRVLDPALSGREALLARSAPLAGLRWDDPGDSSAWPDSVLVEITALDAGGRIVEVISQTLRRAP